MEDEEQVNTESDTAFYTYSTVGSPQPGDIMVYTDSKAQWVTVDGSLSWNQQFVNAAGDTVTWTKKGPWKPTYVRKPKKTVTGEYHSGKLYKRTHTVTIDNDCMEEPQTFDVTEWATMEDIIEARLGDEKNGC